MRRIYLDHAATTAVSAEVLKTMKPYFRKHFGNPSEPHQWGRESKVAIEQAREKAAVFLGAKTSEILFTSGATEAINLAHKGLVEVSYKKDSDKIPHIITSSIEHKAVIETCKHLERLKLAKITYLPVDKNGLVKTNDIKKVVKPETLLVSVMYVNNEMGAIQPIKEISKLIKKINLARFNSHLPPIYFHTDATQAIQYLDCRVAELGVDLLSLSGHKFYAPKGVGLLYFKKGISLIRQQDGGEQENHLRAGTENIPYIVGLGKALELITEDRQQTLRKINNLKEKLISGVLKIPEVKLVGGTEKKAPHIVSFLVKGVEGEAMMLLLSEKGIAASSGSACTSGLLEPSHVLLAMGYRPEEAHGSLRFSLGKDNTKEEIDDVIEALPRIIEKLRKMAPKL